MIETYRLEKRRFREIDEAYAFTEGEGDRSLAYGREGHWRYFVEGCAELKREPSEDMPVICEYFRQVYPKRDA